MNKNERLANRANRRKQIKSSVSVIPTYSHIDLSHGSAKLFPIPKSKIIKIIIDLRLFQSQGNTANVSRVLTVKYIDNKIKKTIELDLTADINEYILNINVDFSTVEFLLSCADAQVAIGTIAFIPEVKENQIKEMMEEVDEGI